MGDVTVFISSASRTPKLDDDIFQALFKLLKVKVSILPPYKVVSIREVISGDVWVKLKMELGWFSYPKDI